MAFFGTFVGHFFLYWVTDCWLFLTAGHFRACMETVLQSHIKKRLGRLTRRCKFPACLRRLINYTHLCRTRTVRCHAPCALTRQFSNGFGVKLLFKNTEVKTYQFDVLSVCPSRVGKQACSMQMTRWRPGGACRLSCKMLAADMRIASHGVVNYS